LSTPQGYTIPHVSSGIVLASIPTVPTASTNTSAFTSAVISSGGTGSSGSTFTTSSTPANIGYQFVTVGNPGNANNSNGLGAVSYAYNIGKYDVTVSQYTTFLNAVASSDPYGLYNTQMNDDATIAGIQRNGSSGSYTYSVVGDGNHPITYVSWFDAARLANWMQNGQPTSIGEVAASTETGAYTLNGATSGIFTKNGNATYWIPTESEWYKAAYYNPTSGTYSTYATSSNSIPGNNASSPTIANQANYEVLGVGYSVTQSTTLNSSQNYLTDVGAFTNSASFYGTFDQSGLVYNWTDLVIGSTERGDRGGSWQTNFIALMSSAGDGGGGQFPTEEDAGLGIRLAALAVPEPTTGVGLLIGSGLLLLRRRKSVSRQTRA
jgi:formylglycine-generating enzyme required for sulfatase activity